MSVAKIIWQKYSSVFVIEEISFLVFYKGSKVCWSLLTVSADRITALAISLPRDDVHTRIYSKVQETSSLNYFSQSSPQPVLLHSTTLSYTEAK